MSTIRERTQQRERDMLSQYACLSSNSRGRPVAEEPCSVRTPFQRDRDRVLHSNAFRRLKDKTQVFLAPSGDHYRTRLTHTLEVSQIARTIACGLELNEDLTEAIALGHDLGHTPFGHAGERALNSVFPGGFTHYEQSLRVVDVLERDGHGLNLTYEVRDGIVCHTKGKEADTLEGRIVKLSDKIAYINHDIDDAIRAGVIEESDIHIGIRTVLGSGKAERINSFVMSVIENTAGEVCMGEKEQKCLNELNEFMFANVYTNPVCKGEESKAMALVCALYEYYVAHPDELTGIFADIYAREGAERAACDYIAGMTDRFALQAYNNLFVPRMWDE